MSILLIPMTPHIQVQENPVLSRKKGEKKSDFKLKVTISFHTISNLINKWITPVTHSKMINY